MHVFFDTILPESLRGGTWLIGNFDGVHRGHQQVISRIKSPRLLTFEPHPREFFSKPAGPFRLTGWSIREQLLARAGVEIVVVRRFDAALANLAAPDFIQQMLQQQLGAERIAVGQDFRFGQGRAGDVALLRQFLPVEVLEPVRDKGGEIISSSRIRAALTQGNTQLAEDLLGQPLHALGIAPKTWHHD